MVTAALAGRRIALLEHRCSDQIATLIKQCGGIAISAPAVHEIVSHDDFPTFIDGLSQRRFSVAIFLNGSGVSTLLAEAERRGRLKEAVEGLHQVTIVCRGAKPLAALKREGLRPRVTAARPYTTKELLHALSWIDVSDRGVVLVHCGDRNLGVAHYLRARGARLQEICPYEWALPEDVEPIMAVVREAIAHRLDALLFTSQVQCRHLFQVALEINQAEGLALSLNQHVVVGAIGAVCASGLQHVGVMPDVIPAHPNMPSLVNAVAQYFESDPPHPKPA